MRIENLIEDRAALGWFVLERCSIGVAAAAISVELDALTSEIRARYPNPASATPRLQAARSLYRAFGIDASRRRPSSEALLRRIIQGKELYRVNDGVDAANICSIRYLLPVGLYDVARLDAGGAELRFREGRAGESYQGIGKGEIALAGRPVLCDALGPFGNPSADSARSSVAPGADALLFVVYAPANHGSLAEAIGECPRIMLRLLSGEFRGAGCAEVGP